jgi:hypothetical protein
MKTIHASHFVGFAVISVYMFVVCAIAVIADVYNISTKVW